MHRRMAAVALGCALVLVSAGLACGSFEEASTPDANDAAAEAVSPVADAAEPDDGGGTFCARNASAALCDDFEQPGRDLAVPTPWTDSNSKGSQIPSIGEGNDSARALNVKGFLSSTDETKLAKLYDIRGKSVRFSVDLKIDKLSKTADSGSNAHVGVVAIAFPNARELVVFLNALATGEINGFVRNALTTNVANVDFALPAVPPSIGGGWFRLVVEYEAIASGSDKLRFYLGAGSEPVLALNGDPPATGESALVVGTRGTGVDCDVDVSIDNVLVTTF